jgi:pimeloyl-ACP methyl ester carboxylesterase
VFFIAVSLAAFGDSASPSQVDLIYDMMSETPTDVLFDLLKAYRHFDVRDFLPKVSVPAVVIGGGHDRLTTPDASVYLAEHLPQGKLQLMERCGHMTMLEQHHAFNTMLEAFFDHALGRNDP